jgi:hypothetical protein
MMSPARVGEVFYDPEFRFRDGEISRKLFVILGIDSDRLYTVARTTSNPASKSRKYGCHNGDRYPNFYIPCEAKLFKEDTWICLDYFSDFAKSEFDTRLAANRLRKIRRLTSGILRDLLTCAIEAEGITTAQEKVVRASLAALNK